MESFFKSVYLHASESALKVTSQFDLVAVQIHHFLGKISLLHDLFLTGFP
jgi:hypothetical protein